MIDDIFKQAAIDILNSPVGEAATYNPAGGTPVPCRVIVNRDILLQPDGITAQASAIGISIEADLSVIGQEPNRGDTFAVGAETFTVQAISRNDGIIVEAIVT
jgi:hypothetical protein